MLGRASTQAPIPGYAPPPAMGLAAGLAPIVAAALLATATPAPVRADILVAAQTISPGVVLERRHLTVQPGEPSPGLVDDLEEAIGQETRVSIYRGRPVRLIDLGPPTLVRRNDIVTLTYNNGGLFIRAEGRALDNGGLGERIRVMNLDSRVTVFGAVAGPQRVEMR